MAERLLENRLVKAAERGTEIFKVREQELFVSVWHAVLGLGGLLLQAHGLGHGLRVTGHLRKLKAENSQNLDMGAIWFRKTEIEFRVRQEINS